MKDVFQVKNKCFDVLLNRWLCIYNMQNFMCHFCGYDGFDGVPEDIYPKVFCHTNGKALKIGTRFLKGIPFDKLIKQVTKCPVD